MSILGIFSIGLFLCFISQSFPTMVFGRVLQALTNGVIASIGQIILMDIYPIKKRGLIMGYYGLALGTTPIISPTIAGIIIDLLNWRILFLIPLIILIISFIWSYFVLEDVLETKKNKLDIISFVMCILSFGGISFGIGNIGTSSFTSPNVLIPLIIGTITLIFFIYRQLNLKIPFLDFRTF